MDITENKLLIGNEIKIKTKMGGCIKGILKSIIPKEDGRNLILIVKEEWHLLNDDYIAEIY